MTFYNFVRMHKTLRMTPAMAAGIADRLWSVDDIDTLVDAPEAPPKKRGPYKPREPTEALPVAGPHVHATRMPHIN